MHCSFNARTRVRRRVRTVFVTAIAAILVGVFFAVAITVEPSDVVTGQPAGSRTGGEPPTMTPPVPAGETAAKPVEPAQPDEARWIDGELVAPLPRDPGRRDAAIARLRANPPAPAGRAPDAQYTGAPGQTALQPVQMSTLDFPTLAGVPFEARSGEGNQVYNLKLPDRFTPTLEQLSAEGQEPTLDRSAEASFASSLIQDFGGIDQTTLTPPDCDLAAGPDHIVAVVNSRYAFYDKCGTNLFEQDFATHLSSSNFLFDPKVVYDWWDDRYIMTICERNNATQESWVVIFISDDADPTGSWCWYRAIYHSSGYWADYQDVHTGPDMVYVTTNMFDWSTPVRLFQYAQIRCLEKAPMLTCAPTGYYDFTNMLNPNDGTKAFSLRPSKMYSMGTYFWLINSVSYGGDFLSLWGISGTFPALTLSGWNIDVPAYDDPAPLEQSNGTYVDCGDARLLNAVYYSGDLWAGHAKRINSGGTDYSQIAVYQVDPNAVTLDWSGGYWGGGLYYAYPAVDFDNLKRGVVCFSRGGPSEFVGTRYANLGQGGGWTTSSLLAAGQANYAGGATGSAADPYRWGDYFGCSTDPFDFGSIWFYGQFASNSPTPSWDTHIGMTSEDGPGVLDVTPSAPFVSTGVQFGPFTPPSVTYTLENTGGTGIEWTLTGMTTWEYATDYSGKLGPGGSTTLDVILDAAGLYPGSYGDYYYFNECYSGASIQRLTDLTVGIDGSCPGSIVDLYPATPPTNVAPDDSQERGVFVTAIKDFEVCAIGWKADLALPQTLTARIYEASGTTRGALLATGTLTAVIPGDTMHYIPISYYLSACQDYDITVQFGTTNSWDWYHESLIEEPFDAGGVIRVRDGEVGGGASNSALPIFSVIGSEPVCDQVADILPPGSSNSSANSSQERGIFVRAQRTVSLCSFGWYADLVIPQVLTARVYEASGKTRGNVIAEATWEVTAGGMRWHDIPINVTLLEGYDYDLAIEFGPTNSWPWWDERPLGPVSVAPFDSVDGEMWGSAGNYALPHYRVGYSEAAGGAPFDLAKLTGSIPPPNSTSQDNYDYGAYVTSLIDQEVYSVGWEADVPTGAAIGARVWEATGTTRGALLSEGWIQSSGSGFRWHDVPVAASLVAGAEYDIEIDITQVDEWHAWSDHSGLPYDSYGVMRVRDGEQGGSASNGWLIHMRYNGCSVTATAVEEDKPARVPMYLSAPAPNPVSTAATLSFGLEQAADVTMTVYDVKGRRVTTLLNGERRQAGPNSVSFDASDLPSGVYFVKMSANFKSLTRKIVVTH